ncbi:MAG: hypothetical protein JWP89_272 [Schlesneria sp.]|nr:hypothetical protein [Schlesneria sp.]
MTVAADEFAIMQDWNNHKLVQQSTTIDDLFQRPPNIGVVIGTFAALPYIHLQLEARRRFYPGVPLLVHDDGSHQRDTLRSLCRSYDCDFESNSVRQPPCIGDLTAFLGGLVWAKARGVDLMTKLSRRWIFLTDWTKSLSSLAMESQYATFCSYTTTFDFGFRTECLGLAVAQWGEEVFLNDLWSYIHRPRGVFVEGYLHEFARRLEGLNSQRAERWRAAHPMTESRTGYALWTLMGTDRCEKSPFYLWHDSRTSEDYHHQALEWGLNYSLADFQDPNQGAGDGTGSATPQPTVQAS